MDVFVDWTCNVPEVIFVWHSYHKFWRLHPSRLKITLTLSRCADEIWIWQEQHFSLCGLHSQLREVGRRPRITVAPLRPRCLFSQSAFYTESQFPASTDLPSSLSLLSWPWPSRNAFTGDWGRFRRLGRAKKQSMNYCSCCTGVVLPDSAHIPKTSLTRFAENTIGLLWGGWMQWISKVSVRCSPWGQILPFVTPAGPGTGATFNFMILYIVAWIATLLDPCLIFFFSFLKILHLIWQFIYFAYRICICFFFFSFFMYPYSCLYILLPAFIYLNILNILMFKSVPHCSLFTWVQSFLSVTYIDSPVCAV